MHPHIIHGYLGPYMPARKRHLICLAIFLGLTSVPNSYTDHGTCDVRSNRPQRQGGHKLGILRDFSEHGKLGNSVQPQGEIVTK